MLWWVVLGVLIVVAVPAYQTVAGHAPLPYESISTPARARSANLPKKRASEYFFMAAASYIRPLRAVSHGRGNRYNSAPGTL